MLSGSFFCANKRIIIIRRHRSIISGIVFTVSEIFFIISKMFFTVP